MNAKPGYFKESKGNRLQITQKRLRHSKVTNFVYPLPASSIFRGIEKRGPACELCTYVQLHVFHYFFV